MRFLREVVDRRIGGMPRTKVTVSLEPRIAAEARSRAGSDGLSSLVNDALRWYLQRLRLDEWSADMEREHGPCSDEDREEAERAGRRVEAWLRGQRQSSA
jgi:hypothetical protein